MGIQFNQMVGSNEVKADASVFNSQDDKGSIVWHIQSLDPSSQQLSDLLRLRPFVKVCCWHGFSIARSIDGLRENCDDFSILAFELLGKIQSKGVDGCFCECIRYHFRLRLFENSSCASKNNEPIVF